MFRKATIAILFILFVVNTGCSTLNRIVYHPNINQGNYLTTTDIAKLHVGMTKQQIAHILGMPVMDTISDRRIWYYIFRKQYNHGKIFQQTLILTFNEEDILTNINNKFNLIGSDRKF